MDFRWPFFNSSTCFIHTFNVKIRFSHNGEERWRISVQDVDKKRPIVTPCCSKCCPLNRETVLPLFGFVPMLVSWLRAAVFTDHCHGEVISQALNNRKMWAEAAEEREQGEMWGRFFSFSVSEREFFLLLWPYLKLLICSVTELSRGDVERGCLGEK